MVEGGLAFGEGAVIRHAFAGMLAGLGAALATRVLVLFLAASFIFFASAVLPGDFVSGFLGQDYTEPVAATMRHELGLDQPLLLRYWAWIRDTLSGDFGTSFTTQTPVLSLVLPRLAGTAALAGVTIAIWFPLSLGLGMAAAVAGGRPRRVVRFLTRLLMPVPEFMLAYALIYVCAVLLHLAPATSRLAQGEPIFGQWRLLILPSTALGIAMLAYVASQVDALLAAEEEKDYFEYACLRGRRRAGVVFFLALPEIAPAVASLFFTYLAYLVTGVLVVEAIFGFAGLGDLMISAVLAKDVPVMQFCALLITATYSLAYGLADAWSARSTARLAL